MSEHTRFARLAGLIAAATLSVAGCRSDYFGDQRQVPAMMEAPARTAGGTYVVVNGDSVTGVAERLASVRFVPLVSGALPDENGSAVREAQLDRSSA